DCEILGKGVDCEIHKNLKPALFYYEKEIIAIVRRISKRMGGHGTNKKGRAVRVSPAFAYLSLSNSLLARDSVFRLRCHCLLRNKIGNSGSHGILACFGKLVLKRNSSRDDKLLAFHVDNAHPCLAVLNDVRYLLSASCHYVLDLQRRLQRCLIHIGV